MRDREQGAQQDADASYHHVCYTKEGVLATHDGAGADQDGLCAVVAVDGKV